MSKQKSATAVKPESTTEETTVAPKEATPKKEEAPKPVGKPINASVAQARDKRMLERWESQEAGERTSFLAQAEDTWEAMKDAVLSVPSTDGGGKRQAWTAEIKRQEVLFGQFKSYPSISRLLGIYWLGKLWEAEGGDKLEEQPKLTVGLLRECLPFIERQADNMDDPAWVEAPYRWRMGENPEKSGDNGVNLKKDAIKFLEALATGKISSRDASVKAKEIQAKHAKPAKPVAPIKLPGGHMVSPASVDRVYDKINDAVVQSITCVDLDKHGGDNDKAMLEGTAIRKAALKKAGAKELFKLPELLHYVQGMIDSESVTVQQLRSFAAGVLDKAKQLAVKQGTEEEEEAETAAA